jgi:transcriptional regulator with XRE-family HTH domain
MMLFPPETVWILKITSNFCLQPTTFVTNSIYRSLYKESTMAKSRTPANAGPAPGSIATILRELIRRDGRSPRRVSMDAGMSPDAARNVMNGIAAPRQRTLDALAATLGVPVGVLLGAMPMPDPAALGKETMAAKKAPQTTSGGSPAPAERVRDVAEVRRLRIVVRDAVRDAVAGGVVPEVALADAVQAAVVGAGWLG